MNNEPTINNELFLTQDPFAGYLFGAVSPDVSPNAPTSSEGEWFTDEFQNTDLFTLMPDFLKQEVTMVDYYSTEPSPALTSSSPTSTSGSSVHDSPLSSAGTPPVTAMVAPPLFPDISPKKPGFRAIAPAAKKQPVPIMPKSSAVLTPSPAPLLPAALAPHHLSTLGAQHIHHANINSGKRKHLDEKESDEIAMKRQKNTDAARRSRLKKLVKMEALEARVVELETDNTKLSTRIAVLESEKSGLESKDKGLEDRIRTLEAQLAEAHKALTTRH